ncbi:MAG: gluconokinase, partial [Acidobacteriota bacterium]|nr:gluconokinase [Acidobacteriota bacterium]
SYRDRLRAAGGTGLRFVLLDVPAADLRQRLAVRQDHFMPPSLLASQLDTLERPVAEADAFIVDGTPAIDTEVEQVTKWLSKPRILKSIGSRA